MDSGVGMKSLAIRCHERPSVQKEVDHKIQEEEKRDLGVAFIANFRWRKQSNRTQNSDVDLKA